MKLHFSADSTIRKMTMRCRELTREVRQILPYLTMYAAIHGDYSFRKVKSSVSVVYINLL